MKGLAHSDRQEPVSIPGGGKSETEGRRLTSLAAHLAAFAHGDQRYSDHPYLKHLTDVADILVGWGCDAETVAAGWLHDVLEDTKVGPTVIFDLFGPRVGWMVSALTGIGDTRQEKMASIYVGIAQCTPEAAVVKLADRIANVEAAPVGSSHLARYAREQNGFRRAIRPLVTDGQWERLVSAFASKATPPPETGAVGTSASECTQDGVNHKERG